MGEYSDGVGDIVEPDVLAAWIGSNASRLATVDPDEPLDDLEPLREIVGDARVVAVGEGAHFVEEFGSVEARVLRFLVERCGFRVMALEFGLRDALALQPWLHGQGDEDDLVAIGGTLATAVNGELFRWIRGYLSRVDHPLRTIGLDIPTTMALERVLGPLADYLEAVDPDIVPTVQEARSIAARIDAASAALAAPRWSQLSAVDQNRLTALVTRVELRMRALRPLYTSRSEPSAYDLALRDIDAATHIDYMLGAMHGIYTGTDLPGDTSAREAYMAESMRWHLDRLDPDDRVVLISHANHVQKTPILYEGHLSAFPLGHYLDTMLGSGYRSILVTHTGTEMPEMVYPDDTSEVGFTLAPTALDVPEPGSVERALVDAQLGDAITLTDLRGAPPITGYRAQSTHLDARVAEAFDAVISTTTARTDPTTGIPFSSRRSA